MLLVDRFLATRIVVALGFVDTLSCGGISVTRLVEMSVCWIPRFGRHM